MVKKKHTVGGSVEQLPNTCQVGSTTIDDLAVVRTIMKTIVQSPNVSWLKVGGKEMF